MSIDSFSAQTRTHNLDRLGSEVFEVLVIGGGITGAGTARLAARLGYKVALVEKGDFAGGTSSKSSKLIHGGLRYLATGGYGLVWSACHERRRLLSLAPHLVWPLPFVLPVYRDDDASLAKIRAGMWIYDGLASFRNVGRHQIWPARRLAAEVPFVNPSGLAGAAFYYDCATDDARLTLANIRDAHASGAVIANYAEVKGLLSTRGRVTGVQVRDLESGRELEVRARVTVSAMGPWTDGLRRWVGAGQWLRPTKGVHLVVPRERLPLDCAVTFTSPRDRRFLFLVPWQSRIIIGTTDTDDDGDRGCVAAAADDVAYLLDAVRHAFPAARLNEEDVISTYAGLRPLISQNGSIYHNTRDHRVEETAPGLIAIAGGKLTTYRLMARDAVRMAARRLGQTADRRRAQDRQPLPGGLGVETGCEAAANLPGASPRLNLSGASLAHLISTYGSETNRVLELGGEQPALAECMTPDLPAVYAQVVHALRHEMALTLVDVLDRRTHILNLAADQGLGAMETVAGLMAHELNWTARRRAEEVSRYRREVALSRQWRGEAVYAA